MSRTLPLRLYYRGLNNYLCYFGGFLIILQHPILIFKAPILYEDLRASCNAFRTWGVGHRTLLTLWLSSGGRRD